jgi:hypothetical protein
MRSLQSVTQHFEQNAKDLASRTLSSGRSNDRVMLQALGWCKQAQVNPSPFKQSSADSRRLAQQRSGNVRILLMKSEHSSFAIYARRRRPIQEI